MQDIKEELQVIADLMAELQDKMAYGEDDFSERLGRKKPEMGMKVEIESEEPMDEMMGDEEEMEDEDQSLKSRLMKMRS